MELQEHERALHPSRLPGEEIADAHLDWILHQAERDGIVLVAECDERFVGFVAGWVQQIAVIAETADSNRFGYISDIYVMPSYRGRQIAVQLLNAIEQYLRGYGIALLRINTWRRMSLHGGATNAQVSSLTKFFTQNASIPTASRS